MAEERSERSQEGSLMPPMELIRQRVGIATSITTTGIIEGELTIGIADASELAAMIIALNSTQDALDEIERLARKDRKSLLDAIAAHVETMRRAIARRESGRLVAEAQVYAAAFRTPAPTKVTLPPKIR